MTCLPKYGACLDLLGQRKCYKYEILTSSRPIFLYKWQTAIFKTFLNLKNSPKSLIW